MKGIDLVGNEERFVYGSFEVDGYEIPYRRVPEPVSSKIIKRNTKFHRKRGEVTDWGQVSQEILEYMILPGWKGIYVRVGGERREAELSGETISALPSEVQADLIELSGAKDLEAQRERDGKNSETTSGSSPSTTA